jgi:hypothetical protein
MMTISEQKEKVEAEMHKLEQMGGSVTNTARHLRDSAFTRFPAVFALLTTFGLVATFYGFEKMIDGLPFFAEHPSTVLLAGLATLVVTGTLYKKLN